MPYVIFSFVLSAFTTAVHASVKEQIINRRDGGDDYHGSIPFHDDYLRLYRFSTLTDAKCNDKTSAGLEYRFHRFYYDVRGNKTRSWLVMLEGGFYCFDSHSCVKRKRRTPFLTGSGDWRGLKLAVGVLSSRPKENPPFHSFNKIYVPYCSSDLWIGRSESDDWAFRGRSILIALFTALTQEFGLRSGHTIVLSGQSAGGLGVLLNIDYLMNRLIGVKFYGLIDSAWFLDSTVFPKQSATRRATRSTEDSVRKGLETWKAELPDRCRRRMIANRNATNVDCFYASNLIRTTKSHVYVIQSYFDTVQISELAQFSSTKDINKNAKTVKRSLRQLRSVFATACPIHGVLNQPQFGEIKIRKVRLAKAIKCWIGKLSGEQRRCKVRAMDRCTTLGCSPNCPTRDISPTPPSDATSSNQNLNSNITANFAFLKQQQPSQ